MTKTYFAIIEERYIVKVVQTEGSFPAIASGCSFVNINEDEAKRYNALLRKKMRLAKRLGDADARPESIRSACLEDRIGKINLNLRMSPGEYHLRTNGITFPEGA